MGAAGARGVRGLRLAGGEAESRGATRGGVLRQAGGAGRRTTRLAGKGLAAVGAAGMGRGGSKGDSWGLPQAKGRGMGLMEEEGGLAAGRGLRQALGSTGRDGGGEGC